jgi:hypothetical protein
MRGVSLSDIGLGDQLDSRVFDKESIAVTKFRIRITDHVGKVSYLVRRAGNIDINYISADEVPLALSNTFGYEAAEVRFALEDSENPGDAVKVVRAVLANKWMKNPELQPIVEELV